MLKSMQSDYNLKTEAFSTKSSKHMHVLQKSLHLRHSNILFDARHSRKPLMDYGDLQVCCSVAHDQTFL